MYLDRCSAIMENVSRVIVGKKAAIERVMVALLADGHILLEDVPGLGKTLMAKTFARSIRGDFKRIQFTPDLLPADITGFNVFNQQAGQFDFKPGPIMANILLADEINRAIPRTQSSLLEGMEERQVTIDGKTLGLPRPGRGWGIFLDFSRDPSDLRSGVTRLQSETPGEYGDRLSLHFGSIGPEIEFLIDSFHLAVYGGAQLDLGRMIRIKRALRRLKSPAFWPLRFRQIFFRPETDSWKIYPNSNRTNADSLHRRR